MLSSMNLLDLANCSNLLKYTYHYLLSNPHICNNTSDTIQHILPQTDLNTSEVFERKATLAAVTRTDSRQAQQSSRTHAVTVHDSLVERNATHAAVVKTYTDNQLVQQSSQTVATP